MLSQRFSNLRIPRGSLEKSPDPPTLLNQNLCGKTRDLHSFNPPGDALCSRRESQGFTDLGFPGRFLGGAWGSQ